MENSDNIIMQEDNDEEPKTDENSFLSLYKSINQSNEELNLEHDYRFNESCDDERNS